MKRHVDSGYIQSYFNRLGKMFSARPEDVVRFARDSFDSLSPEVRAQIVSNIVLKKTVSRFERYMKIVNRLLKTGKPVVTGTDLTEEYAHFLALVSHAEGLWEDACRMYQVGSYPTSLFLSIVCIEEIGKIGVGIFQMLLNEIRRKSRRFVTSSMVRTRKKKKKEKKHPFFSHRQKHLLAAGAGALVNSRLDRVLGLARVIKFLDEVENGKIERLRQSCLYADHDGKKPIIPKEIVTGQQSLFYVVLAGELLAEIPGLDPKELERLLKKVKSFETRSGI